jgi:hypothetical protein
MSLEDPNVVNARKRKRVALVIGNPATSTTTGWPVGFWWSELTHPYFVFSERGIRGRDLQPGRWPMPGGLDKRSPGCERLLIERSDHLGFHSHASTRRVD